MRMGFTEQKHFIMHRFVGHHFIVPLLLAATVAAAPALAQSARNGGVSSGRQAPALAPDEFDTSARVEVRQPEPGVFEVKVGSATVRSSNWVEVEKRVIELLPQRTIIFVNPAGEEMHVSPRAMFGVLLEPAVGALAAQINVQPTEALVVTEVQPSLPAARAGLQVYDVIIECNGVRPMTNARFSEIMAASVPGDTVNVVLMRKGRETEVEVRLDRYDPVAMAAVRAPVPTLVGTQSREELLRNLLSSTGDARNQSGTIAVPKTNDAREVLAVPGTQPHFPDPNSQALREELDGIRKQLRRIEEVLMDLLLLEQQRQPTSAKPVGG